MSRAAVKWGKVGALGLVLAGVLLIVFQEAARFGSPPQKAANHVWLVVARPVLWVWETLGVRGADDLRVVIPMLVSVLLYLAGLGFVGGVILRKATHYLKMPQEQIAEGTRRAAAFSPHQTTAAELPEPAFVKRLKLQGIAGQVSRRLAIINGKTFAAGESASVKVSCQDITIRCVAIGERSATITIEGVNGSRELRLGN